MFNYKVSHLFAKCLTFLELKAHFYYFFRAQAFGEALRKDRDSSAEKGTTKKEGERASGGSRKNAALSRLVAKRVLARLARARKFVVKLRRGIRKISRKEGKSTAENARGKFRKLCVHRQKGSDAKNA